MSEKKNSEARIRANNKYNAKTYDRINLAVPKGKKEIFQIHAQSNGESLNAFANRAMAEAMERDNSAPPTTVTQTANNDVTQTANSVTEKVNNGQLAAEKPPQPKTVKEHPVSPKAFTPEAHKAVNLEKLPNDILYQMDIANTYGTETLANLLNEARSIQESAIHENGGATAGE